MRRILQRLEVNGHITSHRGGWAVAEPSQLSPL
jgi:hypothetical protein